MATLSSTPRTRRLFLVKEFVRERRREPLQLSFSGVERASEALISASSTFLHSTRLRDTLRRLRPRRIVDLRMSPSLRALDLTVERFSAIISECSVEYRTAQDLANRFAGDASGPAAMWQRYNEYLTSQSQALARLRQEVCDGPLLLVSADEEHESSDRRWVVEALSRIRPGFAFLCVES
jgi:hypothetical protein